MTGWAAAPNDFLRDPGVKPSTKAVFMVLASHADKTGRAFPTQKTIAAELGMSEDTVARAEADLVALGLLSKVTQRNASGRRKNIYVVWTPNQPASLPASVPPAPALPAPERVGLPAPEGVKEEPLEEEPKMVHEKKNAESEGTPPRAVVPAPHPSRAITSDWTPSPMFIANLRSLYPAVNLKESCQRFVDFHLSRQDTSRSWEAAFRMWVSQDWEKVVKDRGGTDDFGTPRNQRRSTSPILAPGDEGYVDPEELAAAAVEVAKRAQRV